MPRYEYRDINPTLPAQKHFLRLQDAQDKFQTIQKWFSKSMIYSYFGDGKKQVPGVERQSR